MKLRVIYADRCQCMDRECVRSPGFLNVIHYVGTQKDVPTLERRAAAEHLNRLHRLEQRGYDATQEERYWAIHVRGRHVLHAEAVP